MSRLDEIRARLEHGPPGPSLAAWWKANADDDIRYLLELVERLLESARCQCGIVTSDDCIVCELLARPLVVDEPGGE